VDEPTELTPEQRRRQILGVQPKVWVRTGLFLCMLILLLFSCSLIAQLIFGHRQTEPTPIAEDDASSAEFPFDVPQPAPVPAVETPRTDSPSRPAEPPMVATTPEPAMWVASPAPAAPSDVPTLAPEPETKSPSPLVMALSPTDILHFTKTELIGGEKGGTPFEIKVTDRLITRVVCRIGNQGSEAGFLEIRPAAQTTGWAGPSAVTAREGYALGGLNVDSGGKVVHAIQVVFMRVRPDGQLDPGDSYTSDWIGKPTGPVQKLSSPGARVVGLHGRRMTLVHCIGLVLASNEVPAGPGSAPVPSVPGMDPSLMPRLADLPSGRKAEAEPEAKPAPAAGSTSAAPTSTVPSSALPASASEALHSTVLVEHPLGSGSGFAVAKNVIATNAHVVNGAFPDEITVRCGDENSTSQRISRLLYIDRARDLCLLEGKMDLKPLTVRSDYTLTAGDNVVLMGNPSVRGGIVMRNATSQGTLRTLMHIEGQDLYHIDANVNPGWSGGPVLDNEGRVIAIVVMKANDEVATEIRDAMRKLDDSFRGVEDPGDSGITYGIPGGALARILQNGSLSDKSQQAAAQDRYEAQTLLGRLRFLAGLAMLRVHVNVPLEVRREANAYAQGQLAPRSRFSTIKVDYVPLIPEGRVPMLRALLANDEVEEMEEHFSRDLETRLRNVAASPTLSADTKRDVKALVATIKEANEYSKDPALKYAGYSIKVSGFSKDLKKLLEDLKRKVDDDRPL
jgi:S1-C subfamily serine protease